MIEPFKHLETVIAASSPADCPALLGELERLKGLTQLRMFGGHSPQAPSSQPVGEVRYLTADEVAGRFHVTPKWLYRHKTQMPHSQPSRKVLLFPDQAITKWFASRKKT